MPLYNSILETIGRTPIVRLNHIGPRHVTLYAKVESFNPGGSVKDRWALAVVLDAEQKGVLNPGDTICECTSGNVGIALSMVAAARGYKFVAVMSEQVHFVEFCLFIQYKIVGEKYRKCLRFDVWK